jgi:putative DNA primase/helicase
MRKISDPRVGRQSHSDSGVNGESPAIRAALAVAADYPVFPCSVFPPDKFGKRRKEPLTRHGFKDASQDAAIIAKWWREWPDAYIGVPTGSASGLLVVDIDPQGRPWFEANRGQLGDYQTRQTPRGKHLLYQYPEGVEIASPQGCPVPGVDVRGQGGYMLWWPTLEEVGKPGPLPAWLCKALKKRAVRKLNGHAHGSPAEDWDIERGRLIEILPKLDPDCPHDEWREVLSAISHASGGSKDGENLAVAYSRGDYWSHPASSFPSELEVRKKYRSFKNEKETNTTIATLFKRVKDAGGKVPAGRPENKKLNGAARIVTQLASAIGMKPVDWLWKEYLARGMLHLIAGDGGHAKSTVALSWLATITKGGAWPDGTRCEHRGQALIWSGEDATAQTIVPRLTAARADLDKVSIITGAVEAGKQRDFDPARDLQDLRRHARSLPHLRMIVVDPIICVVDGDSNLGNEVRRSLAPLCALGEELGVMILGVHHFTKNTEGKAPLARVTGSLAFGGLARMVFAVVRDRQDEEHDSRIVVRAKSNIGPDGDGFRYRIQPIKLFNQQRELIQTTKIDWREGVVGRADELLAAAEENNGQPKLEQAKSFLAHVLADGPQTYLYIGKRAQSAQINGRTLLRAKTMLKVESVKDGGRGFGWSWALPEHLVDINAKKVDIDAKEVQRMPQR